MKSPFVAEAATGGDPLASPQTRQLADTGPCYVTPSNATEQARPSHDATAGLPGHAQRFMQALSLRMAAGTDGLGKGHSVLTAFESLDSAPTGPGQVNIKRVIHVRITWEHLVYEVPVRTPGKLRKAGLRRVLAGLTGAVAPGRLLAVMGPTGCGKTSLLCALAGRLPSGGTLSGSILVNGQPRTKAFYNIAAFVTQDDVMFSNLTVRETLRVAADLRLPSSVPASVKGQVVDDVIAELGLAKAADTWIGNDIVRGISGGEKKRTTIGVEMMSNPSVVFLDEPTSGLDAFQAQNVIEALHSLTQRGRTVLCTIHQPRSSIYRMFDLLCLISEGRQMYYGEASHAVAYFTGQGFPCPEHFNPADFFLDVVSLDFRSPEAEEESRARVDGLAEAFATNPPQEELAAHDVEEPAPKLDGVKAEFSFANTRPRQYAVLLGRAVKQVTRDVIPLFFSFVLTTIIGVLLGLIYLQIDMDQRGIQDRVGILFFITLFNCFSNFQPVLEVFPAEKSVVQRERASKSYCVSPYYLAKLTAETPVRVLSSLLFASIVYWMVGLNPGAKQFFTFFAICFVESLTAISLGIMISAAVPNEKVAFAVSPAFLVILMLFGGFYANQDTIPAWLSWIRYLSFLYYAFSALMVNEFSGACCWSCSNGGGDTVEQQGEDIPGCMRSGDQILERWGFGSWPRWAGFAGLIGCLLVQHALGYTILRKKKLRYLPLHQTAAGPSPGGPGAMDVPAGKAGGKSSMESMRTESSQGRAVEEGKGYQA